MIFQCKYLRLCPRLPELLQSLCGGDPNGGPELDVEQEMFDDRDGAGHVGVAEDLEAHHHLHVQTRVQEQLVDHLGKEGRKEGKVR